MGEEGSHHQCMSNRGPASGAAILMQRGRDDRRLRLRSAHEGNGAGQSAGRPGAVRRGGLAEARSRAALCEVAMPAGGKWAQGKCKQNCKAELPLK